MNTMVGPAAPNLRKGHLSSAHATGARRGAHSLDTRCSCSSSNVHAQVKHSDAAALRGWNARFAERLQIQASYWSPDKGRSRQIGERLARQFETSLPQAIGWWISRTMPCSYFAGDSVSASAPKGE